MHERALMLDVMRKIREVAEIEGATRVSRVGVRLGPLSHFTVEHFNEHFVDAARGTIAEGAEVDAAIDGSITGDRAADVVVDSVEIELAEPVEAH